MPTHHFTLIVDGADLQDESVVNSLFESGCDDALVGSTDGVQFIDFDRDAASLKAAIQSAVADAERVDGIRVLTGTVHHAMAALEATARDVTGEPKSTLGQLIRPLNLKPPLNQAMGNLWSYASNEARHGSENSSLDESEAELIVLVASGICTFLAKSHSRTR